MRKLLNFEQVDDGQPYCLHGLHALQTLSLLIMDKDTSLFPCLIEGVPTGFDKNIPKSNVFAPRESDSTIDAELLLCEGNWSSAEANPDLLRQLVAKEVEAGHLVPVLSGLAFLFEVCRASWLLAPLMSNQRTRQCESSVLTKGYSVCSVMVSIIFIASARSGRAFQHFGGPALGPSSCEFYIF